MIKPLFKNLINNKNHLKKIHKTNKLPTSIKLPAFIKLLGVFCTSMFVTLPAFAELQVSQVETKYIDPQAVIKGDLKNAAGKNYQHTNFQHTDDERLQRLILEKNAQLTQQSGQFLQIQEKSVIRTNAPPAFGFIKKVFPIDSQGIGVQQMDFKSWLNANPQRQYEVSQYQQFLAGRVGAYNVPPMEQLLKTARSWAECGYEPYQLPPKYLWSNMVPTLKLYATLKQQGILPYNTIIRSVYRNPALNECAGGSKGSKHMTNGAMDVWVPEFETDFWLVQSVQNNLCQFWQYQGAGFNFGLGLYPTGSIHLDTQGYRMWGASHSSSSSPCRFN